MHCPPTLRGKFRSSRSGAGSPLPELTRRRPIALARIVLLATCAQLTGTGTAATPLALPAIIDDAALSHAVVTARERFLARQPFDRFDVTVLRFDGKVRAEATAVWYARVLDRAGAAC